MPEPSSPIEPPPLDPGGAEAPHRSFSDWASAWIRLAEYPGPIIPDADQRIAQAIELWHQPIPTETWRRSHDSRLRDRQQRYCRSNAGADAVRRGEHRVEYELLDPDPSWNEALVMGARLIDGVNAVPLAKDSGGGRVGNVEADMLLLVQDIDGRFRLELVEVKVSANNAWYAAIEVLRQLKLLRESETTRRLFEFRRPELRLPPDLCISGLVVAPRGFFTGKGKKGNAVKPAQLLLDRLRADAGIDVRLAIWESGAIQPLTTTGASG